MFGFGKKKVADGSQKKHSALDKILMGAIVGGAIGSVVGMSIAPKKGSETREIIAQKGKELYQKGHDVATKMQNQSAPKEVLPKRENFFKRIINKLGGSSQKNNSGLNLPQTKSQTQGVNLKKIPHEVNEL